MTLLSTLYGRLRLEDCLSPGVQDQPAHYKENLLKKERRENMGKDIKGGRRRGKGWNLQTFLAPLQWQSAQLQDHFRKPSLIPTAPALLNSPCPVLLAPLNHVARVSLRDKGVLGCDTSSLLQGLCSVRMWAFPHGIWMLLWKEDWTLRPGCCRAYEAGRSL